MFTAGAARAGTDRAIVKYKPVAIAASTTDGAVVTAVTGKKIKVLGVILSGPTSTTITFNSKPAGAGTAISAAFTYVAGAVTVIPSCVLGYFETVVSEGLTATTGVGGPTQVHISYIEVPV